MKLMRASLLGFAFLAVCGSAFAAGSTTFQVNATVVASCSFTSAANISFGTFTGTAITNNASNIVISCNGNNVAYTVTLNNGSNAPATGTVRNIKNTAASADLLPYFIGKPTLSGSTYSCPASPAFWGTAAGTTLTGTSTSTGAITIPMCATLTAATSVVPGNYSDTVTATLTP